MSETLPCSGCGKQLRVHAELAGKRVRCPACGAAIVVPAAPKEVVARARPVVVEEEPEESDSVDEEDRPRKRRSRQKGSAARGWLGILMALYFPFIGFICLLATAFSVLFLLLALNAPRPRIGGALFVIALFSALTVVHVLWALRGLFQHNLQRDPLEFPLPDEWQEGLLDLIEEVAESRDLPTPDEVRLTAGDVAYVYETLKGRRILVVGGLAIAAFTQEALAGVIAHELGHFGGGDTRRSRLIYHWLVVIESLERQFAASESRYNPLIWLLRVYHYAFKVALSACSREEEYRADSFEVEHVGPEKAGATLVLLTVLHELPWARLQTIAEASVADGRSLEDIFAEQVRRTRKASRGDWEDAFRKAMREATGPFDTHPCLKERLKAIGISPKKALAAALKQDGEPATDLFLNWPLLEKFLSTRIMNLVREYYLAKQEFSQIARAVMR